MLVFTDLSNLRFKSSSAFPNWGSKKCVVTFKNKKWTRMKIKHVLGHRMTCVAVEAELFEFYNEWSDTSIATKCRFSNTVKSLRILSFMFLFGAFCSFESCQSRNFPFSHLPLIQIPFTRLLLVSINATSVTKKKENLIGSLSKRFKTLGWLKQW